MDAIFHSSKKDFDESADVLVVGYDDGTIHLSLYDFFEIGTISTLQISPDHVNSRLFSHSSHSLCSTHALLVMNSSKSQDELYFVPFDLRLIPETGRYLSLLASKSTRLRNVLRYIREAQIQIYREFNASQDLPRKFIRNIEETLQEKDHCSFVTAAYHLVVTGNCFPLMKEWLVEELGDRVCWGSDRQWNGLITDLFSRGIKDGIKPSLVVMRIFGDLSMSIFSQRCNASVSY